MDDTGDVADVITGTTQLIAPVENRLYSVNSTGNTNRNASQDIRGEAAEIVFDEKVTAFWSSPNGATEASFGGLSP